MSDIGLIVLLLAIVIVLTSVSRRLALSTPIVMVLGADPRARSRARPGRHARPGACARTDGGGGLDHIEELADEFPGYRELIDALRTQYEYRTKHAESQHGDEPGVIDDGILRRIERDLDLEELRMEA